jgi:murein DD-endopeptidase MepM/ murein hydrolase activator NlpD
MLSKWSDLYGNMVEVANATTGKIEEYYGHLADRLVKVGDLISEGTVIGTLGKTGSTATGVHLHLQMYDENGQLIDPMARLPSSSGPARDQQPPNSKCSCAISTGSGCQRCYDGPRSQPAGPGWSDCGRG